MEQNSITDTEKEMVSSFVDGVLKLKPDTNKFDEKSYIEKIADLRAEVASEKIKFLEENHEVGAQINDLRLKLEKMDGLFELFPKKPQKSDERLDDLSGQTNKKADMMT